MSSAALLRFPFGGLIEESADEMPPARPVGAPGWFHPFAPATAPFCPETAHCAWFSCVGTCPPPPDAA